MFSKLSRYRKLDNLHVSDRHGRQVLCKTLRMAQEPEGRLLHTLDQNDRLDHLGYKYYKQTRHWWRICDANPAFMSPLELLGRSTLSRCRIALLGASESHPFPWAELRPLLTTLNGVMDVNIEEDSEWIVASRQIAAQTVEVTAESFARAVLVDYNSAMLDSHQLAAALVAGGFPVAQPEVLTRPGATIVVPSAPVL